MKGSMTMYNVIKRDGKVAEKCIDKISGQGERE